MTGRDVITLNLTEKSTLSGNPKTCSHPQTTWTQWETFQNTSGTGDGALFADPCQQRERPRRFHCFCLSLLVQGSLLGVWLFQSMVPGDELPAPQVVKTFMVMAPLAPAPPPPPLAPAVPTSVSTKAKTATSFAAPILQPAALEPNVMPVPETTQIDFDTLRGSGVAGVPFGLSDGVVGGLAETPSSSASEKEATVYRVTTSLDRPDKLIHVDPRYPAIASAARVEGLVILEATIDGNGNVENLRILRSVPLLDDAAVEAVRQWKYQPTVIAGTPVPVQMTVTVKFALA